MRGELNRDAGEELERLMDVGSPAAVPENEQAPFSSRSTGTEAVVASLRTVQDPEIPVNIYDLGLIYRIKLKDGGAVEIDMTLTAPGCPVAGEMLGWVEKAVRGVEGIVSVKVNLVFDPMSEEVKLELGLM